MRAQAPDRPGDRDRAGARGTGDGRRDAAHADLLLPVVHDVAVLVEALGELDDEPTRLGALRGIADSSALPTPVECSGTRRPTSVNIRIGWGEGTCAR